jgi:hypothetical protein
MIVRFIEWAMDWLDGHLPGAANRHIGRVLEQRGL